MAEVPDDQRAGLVGAGGDRANVPDRTGPVIHLIGQHHGGVLGDQLLDGRAVDALEPDREVGIERLHAVEHIEVGREAAAFRHDDLAVRPERECCLERLVDVDRRRVADDDLVRLRADQAGHFRAQGVGEHEPAGLVPARDQVLGPLLMDRPVDLCKRGLGRGAERVAVEIDQSVGQVKQVAERRKFIVRIHLFDRCQLDPAHTPSLSAFLSARACVIPDRTHDHHG